MAGNSSRTTAKTPVPTGTNNADEATNFGAAPQKTLKTNAGTHTPTSIPGGRTMTTHDLAIASYEPFAAHARLVHFSEQVHADGGMTFDYVLRDGIATSRNALRLMQLIGIEPK